MAAAGLLRWGHLRVNVLQVLLHLASSEASCTRLLSQTSDGAAIACVALLLSNASRTDMEGVRTAANILRNLAMPPDSKARIGNLDGIYAALLKHVAHRDPNTATVVGATLRILVDACPPNALRAAEAAVPECGGALAVAADSGRSGNDCRWEFGAGASLDDGFAPILAADLSKMHPFCRVELCRFVCATVSQALGELAPPRQQKLAAPAVLQFGIFLLASKQPSLHHEACAALLAARRAYATAAHEATGGPGPPWPVWPVRQLTVPSPSGERPLAAVLSELASAGTIAQDDCVRLSSAED